MKWRNWYSRAVHESISTDRNLHVHLSYHDLVIQLLQWFRYEHNCTLRSSRRCSVKKGVLRNFAKFTAKHLCQSLSFNKVAGAAPFSQNTSGRLVLEVVVIHTCSKTKHSSDSNNEFLTNSDSWEICNQLLLPKAVPLRCS